MLSTNIYSLMDNVLTINCNYRIYIPKVGNRYNKNEISIKIDQSTVLINTFYTIHRYNRGYVLEYSRHLFIYVTYRFKLGILILHFVDMHNDKTPCIFTLNLINTKVNLTLSYILNFYCCTYLQTRSKQLL